MNTLKHKILSAIIAIGFTALLILTGTALIKQGCIKQKQVRYPRGN